MKVLSGNSPRKFKFMMLCRLLIITTLMSFSPAADASSLFYGFPYVVNLPGGDSIRTVTAVAETRPVPRGIRDDAADDPAIWIHPEKPGKSRIIGTDKKGGLAVYNLRGKQLFYYPDGMMNNADLRYGFPFSGLNIDILAVSNRTNNTIRLYQIALDGSLRVIPGGEFDPDMPDEVYGLCMYKSPVTGKFFVFVNNKDGDVEQWELASSGNTITGKIVRKLRLSSQVEGMVADDELATLFVGEEKKGIWKFPAEPGGGREGQLLPFSSEADNENIRFDIEGLAVYKVSEETGYLIASSQGNDSYAIFNRQSPHEYAGSFRIVDGDSCDGVQETDGLDVTSSPLGRNFPAGILVVQDGSNKNKDRPEPQNFKLVNWIDVARQFMPPLKTTDRR